MAAVPIAAWVRVLITATAAAWANWDSIQDQFQRIVQPHTPADMGRYLQVVFEMKDASGAFSTRERGMVGMHYVNTTGGDLDLTWVTADFTAVESAWDAFFSAYLAGMSTDVRIVEYRWYKFGPGIFPPNPPVRVTTKGTPLVGTGAPSQPHQVAVSVTTKTALRRHWGRVYLPFFGVASTTGGQIASSTCTSIAALFKTLLEGPSTSQGVVGGVYDRNRHGWLGIKEIQVDSVPDVIRRRRPRSTATRAIAP